MVDSFRNYERGNNPMLKKLEQQMIQQKLNIYSVAEITEEGEKVLHYHVS